MKKPIKITLMVLGSILALLLIGLGSLIVYAKYFGKPKDKTIEYYVDELNFEKNDFQNEFAEIYTITIDNYSLYKSKGLNMDSIYNSFSQRMKSPNIDMIEFGNLLREYFSTLNVGHAFVYLKDYTAGYTPVYIENRIFIDNPNEHLQDFGFKDKDEIIAVNGTPLSDWLDEHKKFTSASTEAAKELNTALGIFSSWKDTIATYNVVRNTDTLNINLTLKKYDLLHQMEKHKPLVQWQILNDSIGYINILSMMDPGTNEFINAYKNVQKLPYLIIDIRNNGGGNSGNGT